MEAVKKMFEARKLIAGTKMKKEGRNDFSKYDYFTPGQVELLVKDVCEKLNLLPKFDLIRSELGIEGILTIIDIESNKTIVYRMATDIPEIKATNIVQQLGGCVTYTERYLKMSAFGIVDNNLDFDTEKKQPEAKPKTDDKPFLNPDTEQWDKAVEYMKKDGDIAKIKAKYKIAKINEVLLINQSKEI